MTRYNPHSYQQDITNFEIDVPRSQICSFMGSGKTVGTLTALDCQFIAGQSMPTLVTAPKRVARSVWGDEAAKWDHLRHIQVQPILGNANERLIALQRGLKLGNASVFTINYENLPWLVDTIGASKWPFKTVVSDESSRLKGYRSRQGGKRAQALSRIIDRTERWTNLTGTFAPNGLQDVWGQIYFIDKGQRLGKTFTAFTERWFQSNSYGGFTQIKPLPHAQAEIENKIRDICLALRAQDYFDVSLSIVRNVTVSLPYKAMRLYKDMEKQMFMSIEGNEVEAFNAASKTIKCLQLANGAAYIDDELNWKPVHDEKLEALEQVVEEAGGAAVLVAYHFKSDLARILAHFKKARVIKSKVDEDDWNAGKIAVGLLHPASGGHGLSLQHGGNIICFYGLWWDLEQHQQIIERIGPVRQKQSGYDRPVFVYRIVAKDTMDETVIARLDGKGSVQDLLMDAMRRKKCTR